MEFEYDPLYRVTAIYIIRRSEKMSVKISTLEKKGKEVSTEHGKTQDRVMSWLKQNSTQGFTQLEIATAMDMREQRINNVLHKLLKKNLVTRKSFPGKNKKGNQIFLNYWFIKPDTK